MTGNWTAEARSGWCVMDLHEPADGIPAKGYCPLSSGQCGCPCHTGGSVHRRTAYAGPAAEEPDYDDELEQEDDAGDDRDGECDGRAGAAGDEGLPL